MNILTDTLPESVVIGAKDFAIRTDFRVCLKTIMAFEDPELTPQEKTSILLSNLYPEIPSDIETAIQQANLFLNGGKVNEEESEPSPRVYSFSKDANFIFAAFRQTHSIDLQKADLHWWEFLSLFMDLGSETTFCQLVSLRKRIKTGKASKEERQAAREMGDLIEVPEFDDRTLAEKEAEADFLRKIGQK